jgi:hypothetical protein
MPEFEVRLKSTRDHPKQDLFVNSPVKRKVVRAGRRGGKTTGSAILSLKKFLAGRRILYATPTSDQLDRFWHEIKLALQCPLDAGVYYKNETEHLIELPGTEQRIRCKTAWNADMLRGDYADVLVFDEFQLMNEDAWSVVGAPMLLDNDGDAIFIYTPPSASTKSVTKARDPRHASKLYKRALEDKSGRWLAIHFSSHDNPHISETALADITGDMSKLAYRQEILALDSEDVPGALWTRKLLDDTRAERAPELVRVVVALDPSATSTEVSDECGVIAAGRDAAGHGYVLFDQSHRDTPAGWGQRGVGLYHELHADRLVAETNQGGEMVEYVVRTIDKNVSYRAVHATRGKLVRAEPVVALYERGLIHHVGDFPELEDELCTWVPGAKSPNRLDALVWAMTDLMLHDRELGLLSYLTSGRAEEDLSNVDKVQQAKSLIKPALTDEQLACPECGVVLVRHLGNGFLRCQQCGHQFRLIDAPAVNRGPSRGELLQKGAH